MLSVVIRHADGKGEYVGTGVVRQVKLRRNQPSMDVTLQIDALNPLDRKEFQKTPKSGTNYSNVLDFRVRYDFVQIKS